MKEYLPWLQDADSQALQQACRQLDEAYKRFFHKQGKFPRFTKKSAPKQSYAMTQISVLTVEPDRVKLPKIGWVEAKTTRLPVGTIKRATVSGSASGKYYASVISEEAIVPMPELEKKGGVDLGLRALAKLSDGTSYENPKTLHASMQELVRERRKLSRKVKGLSNRCKQRTE